MYKEGNIELNFRPLLVRLIYFLMGLNVGFWRREIEEIWRLEYDEYNHYLDQKIKSLGLKDGSGRIVESVDDLRKSPKLLKSQISKFDDRKSKIIAVSRHTSGTTGSKIKVILNNNELGRLLAVRDYCLREYGIKLGYREARIWGTKTETFSNIAKDWVLNRKSFCVNDQNLSAIVSEISNWSPKYIYGYSSYILKLANYLVEKNKTIEGVKLIICTAEQILPAQKSIISRAFNSKVIEEYGSTEFDILAFEDQQGDLRVTNPWLVVESIDDSLLVTDIFRVSQPFTRYEIGDSAKIRYKAPSGIGGRQIISDLLGRSINQYAYDLENRTFHSVEFSRALNQYFSDQNEIFDFFIIQKEIGYFDIFLSKEPKMGFGYLNQWLSGYILKRVGSDISIRSYLAGVSDQPIGKRSYFIQEVH